MLWSSSSHTARYPCAHLSRCLLLRVLCCSAAASSGNALNRPRFAQVEFAVLSPSQLTPTQATEVILARSIFLEFVFQAFLLGNA